MASENGWQPAWVGTDRLEWVNVPGAKVKLQLMKGAPSKIMKAFAADYNAYVEPLRDPDSAGYTPTNSVATSNHLNGTAMDLNWDSHPFHVKNTFNASQQKTIRDLLSFYEGTMYWGGDWTSPIDEMHWQMGYNSFDNAKTESFIERKIRSDGFSTYKRGDKVPTAVLASAVTGKKVLPFDTKMIPQETGYWCGPASAQIVLKVRGINVSEQQLARECGTTTGGTDHIRLIERVLDGRLPEANYTSVDMPNDPPTQSQKDKMWADVVQSIDAGYAVLANLVAPPSNYPQGFSYGGGTVFHYVTFTGYDASGNRQLQLSDPGFRPFQGWISFDQAATLLPPKGYCYANVKPIVQTNPVLVIDHKGERPTMATVNAAVGKYFSRSGYRTPGEAAIGDADTFIVNDDAMLHTIFVEWSAIECGDPESIYRIIRSAAGKGADTSPVFIARSRAVLNKVPKDSLAATLSRIETTEPDLLQALVSGE